MNVRTCWIVVIWLLVSGVSHAASPELFRRQAFNAAIIANAVNHYVALGEQAAKAELSALALDDSNPAMRTGDGPLSAADVASRVSWMCLILWPSKPGHSSRPPAFGALVAIDGHIRPEDFPLYPVVQSGISYFILADSYLVGGLPEKTAHYLADCEARGTFRSQPVAVPTRQEAKRDASMLRRSPAWMSGWALGAPLNDSKKSARAFIQAQADSIR